MLTRAEQSKTKHIDRVAAAALERPTAGNREELERFVRRFYERVPPNDVLREPPENLAGAALALWRFAQERQPGEPKIRLYNPRSGEEGWLSSHTVVEVVNDDMPFLVDSVVGELNRLEAEVYLIIHPVVKVHRDPSGRLADLLESTRTLATEALRESWMQVRINAQPSERHEEVRQRLEAVLVDVRAAVDDWRAMRTRCQGIIAELRESPPPLGSEEVAEGISFLEWLDENHFTYLGYREYRFEGEGESAVAHVLPGGLGVLRDEAFPVFDGLRNLGTLPEDVRHFLHQPELLLVTKANRRATVHRPVPMDVIAVKSFDEAGRVTGERLFIGLFTSSAYSRSPRFIPFLRKKVTDAMERSGFAPDSHDGRKLMNILEMYPRDELFQVSVDDLLRISTGILQLQERQRIALFVRRDPFERFVSCLVFVPRDRYDSTLRLKFQDLLLDAYQGQEISAFATFLSEAALARLHLIIATRPGRMPDVSPEDVEQRLVEAGRSWADRLEEALVASHGEEEGLRLARRFDRAFPAAYRERFDEQAGVFDVDTIERVLATGELGLHLYRPVGAAEHELHFKIYSGGHTVPLSEILPMLENMGLKVMEEVPYELQAGALGSPIWIRDFAMVTEDRAGIDLLDVRGAFHEAYGLVWRGEVENDGFNKLVLKAGLVAAEVTVLRAYYKYLRQAKIPFSQAYVEQTLANNPRIARRLADLFIARFDPERREGAEERSAGIVEQIRRHLDEVTNPDEDRIIRRFLNLIQATLRTNFFQMEEPGRPKPYLSLKLDSQRIDELPRPRPFREVFVYSPRVEAIHLRGGKVARGGIRWSDRREDFRTEVLGLMKAQMVKNAVIVPVGSKGGFVVKNPPAGSREKLMEEVVHCYQTMIRGLLDVTDNLRGGEVVPPPQVVRHDEDDPYLVVAADKGTATFSDLANAIAAEYGYWLDDAFASGGSTGYDHKRMAITSRGGWESVKRHFRELGKDVQREDFTVVGVGDMSGDVFGNGMLMSEHIRLVGAFNHLHVFVDPDPEPGPSWLERRRLFELPRSAWTDYDPAAISAGGGVFERRAKSIPVSPEMRRRFGLEGESVTPSELIQALLRAPVELLWFGGIGTYLKATLESDADVGDRANEAVRVDAPEVRAQVIGEGANLAVTQLGRIEYALKGGPEGRGGHLNTDFIDNSAGVDCSDHEVNIKILLNDVERAGGLTRDERNELLRAMTGEVADLVLRDNYLQTQTISVTQRLGARLMDRLARVMRAQQKAGRLDRKIEFLPDEELLAERARADLGFTRPELAVLLSYTKIALYEELLASDLPDDPFMQEDLKLYFPTLLRERFAAEIPGHRLHREIISTSVTNSLVNRAGIAFVHESREKTGMPEADIARAYLISREVFGLRGLWADIEALDNQVPAELQYDMLLTCGRAAERGTIWFLREGKRPLDIGTQIAAHGPVIRELASHFNEILTESDRDMLRLQTEELAERGAPRDLAERVTCLTWLAPILDVVRIARSLEVPADRVGRVYFGIGTRFGFDWVRRAAGRLPADKAWDKLAISAIVDDLLGYQRDLTAQILAVARDGESAEQMIESWAGSRDALVARTEQLLSELQAGGKPDLAMLAVANRQIKAMGG